MGGLGNDDDHTLAQLCFSRAATTRLRRDKSRAQIQIAAMYAAGADDLVYLAKIKSYSDKTWVCETRVRSGRVLCRMRFMPSISSLVVLQNNLGQNANRVLFILMHRRSDAGRRGGEVERLCDQGRQINVISWANSGEMRFCVAPTLI